MFFEENNYRNYDIDIVTLPKESYYQANLKSSISYEPKKEIQTKFLSPEDGLMRGNLISEEYEGYKNYNFFRLVPKTEREVLLFKVYEYDFAVNDLNLYLDLNPRDLEALALFNKYNEALKHAIKVYESIYGPLTLNDSDYDSYRWIDNPWPWENDGGSKYV